MQALILTIIAVIAIMAFPRLTFILSAIAAYLAVLVVGGVVKGTPFVLAAIGIPIAIVIIWALWEYSKELERDRAEARAARTLTYEEELREAVDKCFPSKAGIVLGSVGAAWMFAAVLFLAVLSIAASLGWDGDIAYLFLGAVLPAIPAGLWWYKAHTSNVARLKQEMFDEHLRERDAARAAARARTQANAPASMDPRARVRAIASAWATARNTHTTHGRA